MFERLPQFASGVDTALDIMQHWLERDADGEKTGRYQEIDIGRMNLDDGNPRRIGTHRADREGWRRIQGCRRGHRATPRHDGTAYP